MKLRRATSDAIPAIMAIERQPGYDAVLGQWNAQRHAQLLDDPGRHMKRRPAESDDLPAIMAIPDLTLIPLRNGTKLILQIRN